MSSGTSGRGSRAAIAIGALFVVAGGIGVVGSWAAYWLDTGIEREGQRAEAQLARKTFVFSADGDSEYLIEYAFTLPGGERVKGQHAVSRQRFDALREGDTLTVFYSAENPSRNFPEGGGVTSLGVTAFVSVLAGLFVIAGAALVSGFFPGSSART